MASAGRRRVSSPAERTCVRVRVEVHASGRTIVGDEN
jgi:hypothetical protein